ncbi:MAG: ATP-binding cassette domain-containing protein [Bacteroidaceae bacterium]|nr:ATP-binding cassette domain-containing protein [Bacteroidaceae bacterium]
MIVDYQHIDIYQEENCILKDVNLQLETGDYLYLIGKVGSGKTSLLKTMYGELELFDGKAKVLGYNMLNLKRRQIPTLRRDIGIVFQDFQLLTDRSVYENLAFVLRATKWKNDTKINNRIETVLNEVGMLHKRHKLPNELSGGEQQRIVIARAILNSPRLILADEPTGNLDAETGNDIIELLKKISREGSTVIITTHNLRTIDEHPGKVILCDNHSLTDVTRYWGQRKAPPPVEYAPRYVNNNEIELTDLIRNKQQTTLD